MTTPIGPIAGLGAAVPTPPAAQSADAGAGGGKGFGGLLTDAIGKLEQDVDASSQQAQSLAAGKADNLTEVVMSTEQASLELQLAGQLRNKALEAYQEIFRMQV